MNCCRNFDTGRGKPSAFIFELVLAYNLFFSFFLTGLRNAYAARASGVVINSCSTGVAKTNYFQFETQVGDFFSFLHVVPFSLPSFFFHSRWPFPVRTQCNFSRDGRDLNHSKDSFLFFLFGIEA